MTDKKTPQIDVTQHYRLCHSVAKQFRSFVGKGLDYEDLFQAAFEGIHFAACRYDAARGKFSTIALPMARWHVLKMLRDSRTAVRPPQKAPGAIKEYSLDQPRDWGDMPPEAADETTLSADDAIDAARNKRKLAWAYRALDARERHVVMARMQEKKLNEIGLEMGISRERVRQLEERAYKKMRAALTRHKVKP